MPRPDELERLACLMLGPDSAAEPLPAAGGGGLRAALDGVLVPALERSPCVVSFSGGRDSSAVLALAVDCARRHDLPPPIPAIMRFPGVASTHESGWQELVLRHLGLPDGEVVTLSDELDSLGPVATRVLTRHGLLWPGNVYMHEPLLALAHGGSVLTGVGGDELFTGRSPRRRPRQLAFAALPASARARIYARRHPTDAYAWLTPLGYDRVQAGLARDAVAYPWRWDRALRWWYGSRGFAATNGSLAHVAASDHDVLLINPLLDGSVLAEVSVRAGHRGFDSREEAMRWLCGDLLPDELIRRPTKASFAGAIWGPAMRAFVASWDGSGVDRRSVDVGRLRAEWSRAAPDFRTILLLQQVWLTVSGVAGVKRVQQMLD